jgi:hypothetical protein
MKGYTTTVRKTIQLMLWVLTLAINTFIYVFPGNFQSAIMYVYNFITSAGSWMGYITAAVYYVLTYFGYGA